MSITEIEDLAAAIQRCEVELSVSPSILKQQRMPTLNDCVITREDLAALMRAATWRLGYLEGKR